MSEGVGTELSKITFILTQACLLAKIEKNSDRCMQILRAADLKDGAQKIVAAVKG